jgi:hypothetical protein
MLCQMRFILFQSQKRSLVLRIIVYFAVHKLQIVDCGFYSIYKYDNRNYSNQKLNLYFF